MQKHPNYVGNSGIDVIKSEIDIDLCAGQVVYSSAPTLNGVCVNIGV